jgi:hypothetical protein
MASFYNELSDQTTILTIFLKINIMNKGVERFMHVPTSSKFTVSPLEKDVSSEKILETIDDLALDENSLSGNKKNKKKAKGKINRFYYLIFLNFSSLWNRRVYR